MWPPFCCLSPLFPHHPLRKCFPSLKGEGRTQPHVRLQPTDAPATEGGASEGGARCARGHTSSKYFSPSPQSCTPWSPLKEPCCLGSRWRLCGQSTVVCPPPFTFLGDGEGGGRGEGRGGGGEGGPPLWADTDFTVRVELPGFSRAVT